MKKRGVKKLKVSFLTPRFYSIIHRYILIRPPTS